VTNNFYCEMLQTIARFSISAPGPSQAHNGADLIRGGSGDCTATAVMAAFGLSDVQKDPNSRETTLP
jgi:hypothetical protein